MKTLPDHITEEHRYSCVLDREGWRITFDVYTPRQVTKDELLALAIADAIRDLEYVGIEAQPDEFTAISFEEVPLYDDEIYR